MTTTERSAPTLACPKPVHDALVADARRGVPDEVCGVLGGTFDPQASRITSRYPTPNAADDPERRYRIDPEPLLETLETLESRGESIVGFYHSHPRGPPTPSRTDVDGAAWPDRSYLLVSLEDGRPAAGATVRSWRWRATPERETGGRFERERLVLE
ncbi:desampylase [Natronobiforma cellulositropha]|uniref:desampylase n=1 Tax=Natronobiforma cellulositropha TaxID=1679076 RepID=UPI0021D5A8A6|nr:desampylase [Natronobiforma cellulositropha]